MARHPRATERTLNSVQNVVTANQKVALVSYGIHGTQWHAQCLYIESNNVLCQYMLW